MSGRMVAGVGLISVGVLFLLGGLGLVDQPGAILGAWWPLVFVAIGIGQAVEQRWLGLGPVVFIGLGLVLLAGTTDIVALQARIVWPLVLVAIGVWLIVRPPTAGPEGDGLSDVRSGVTAVFEDRIVRSSDKAFERASVTSIFGDLELDLREAGPGEHMVVDVAAIFGDVDVVVPSGWRVLLTTGSLFASVEHRAPSRIPADDAPVLQVGGFTVFGDVTVRQ